jgi:hypothetical protein
VQCPRVRPRGRAAQRDNGGRPPRQTVTGELRLVGSQRSAATCPRPEDGGSTLRWRPSSPPRDARSGDQGSSTTGPRAPSLVLLASTSRPPAARPDPLSLALGRLDLRHLVHGRVHGRVHVARARRIASARGGNDVTRGGGSRSTRARRTRFIRAAGVSTCLAVTRSWNTCHVSNRLTALSHRTSRKLKS